MDVGPEWVPGIIAIILGSVWCGRLEANDKASAREIRAIQERLERLDRGGSRALSGISQRIAQIDIRLEEISANAERLAELVNALDKRLALIGDRQITIRNRLNRVTEILKLNGFADEGHRGEPDDQPP